MSQHPVDKLTRHLGGVGRLQIERWNDGKDHRSSFGGERHIAQVDAIEGRLADAENQRAALFESYIGGAGDERVGEANLNPSLIFRAVSDRSIA
jgi:hypothetical protein